MFSKHPMQTAVEKGQVWARELAWLLGLNDMHLAHSILRAVLHALRDRLPVAQVAQLGAQLPTAIRGIYYEGWHPAGKPLKIRHKDEFLEAVAVQMGHPDNLDLDLATTAVFDVLCEKISSGEMHKIAGVLPEEIRAFMPADVRAF